MPTNKNEEFLRSDNPMYVKFKSLESYESIPGCIKISVNPPYMSTCIFSKFLNDEKISSNARALFTYLVKIQGSYANIYNFLENSHKDDLWKCALEELETRKVIEVKNGIVCLIPNKEIWHTYFQK